ncbi:MAG: hypothetical protein IPH07_39100 [Deltaproteobacteria bacterium]|nr:hypothetical protein [Deltaproteobacteria bacterium]MBK8713841.1 hypothetical protein [Deltaproteobacteria bacterium]MBP7291319.1 hypothetical protein [Nannocystaceae bacterium]
MSIAIRTALFALAAAAPCCPSDSPRCVECGCLGPATRFDITGDGNGMRVLDSSGAMRQSVEVDLSDCDCGAEMDEVLVTVRHREGFALAEPMASDCILDPAGGGTSEVSFTVVLGEACELPWFPRDGSPTIVFPIKVKP